MKKLRKRSACPISSALDIFGDKWSLLIVRDILMYKKRTYNEFLHSKEGIATNILADRLGLLEAIGIISKEKQPEGHNKYFYRLTRSGLDLAPILIEIILWSDRHLTISPEAKRLAKQLRESGKV